MFASPARTGLVLALIAAAPGLAHVNGEPVPGLRFEPGVGQADSVRFVARGAGLVLWLEPDALVVRRTAAGKTDAMRMRFAGGARGATLVAEEPIAGAVHRLVGSDPARWRPDLPQFAQVRYRDVYPGIDVLVRGEGGFPRYDFILAPGADASAIALAFEGAHAICLDGPDLVVEGGLGPVTHRIPAVYEESAGERRELAAAYELLGGLAAGIRIEGRDAGAPTVVDPVMAFGTYLGGSDDEVPGDLVVDAVGNSYVTGWTLSTDFPTAFPVQPSSAGSYDVFVTKVDESGSLVYSTYLGGSDWDEGNTLLVDGSGSVYVTGTTRSPDFPQVAPLQAFAGYFDVFVTRLDPSGAAIVSSTFFGGRGWDEAAGIALGATGDVYLTGWTDSDDFPLVNPFQSTLGFVGDAFVSRLDLSSAVVRYSSYLGGAEDLDYGHAVEVDAGGGAWVVGYTLSSDFPTRSPYQGVLKGANDGFLSRITPWGGLAYATYLGGSSTDSCNDVAIDGAGRPHVIGTTSSADFPVWRALQPTMSGSRDAFVTAFDGAGSSVAFSTFLGGAGWESGFAVDLAADGTIHAAGVTASSNFPVLHAVQEVWGGTDDAFVCEIGAMGSPLVFSTFLGGHERDDAAGMDVDGAGNVHVMGRTASTDLPTQLPFQPFLAGVRDTFLARIEHSPTDPVVDFQASPFKGDAPLAVTFSNRTVGTVTGYLWDFGDGETSTQFEPTHTYAWGGDFDVSLTAQGPTGTDNRRKARLVRVKPTPRVLEFYGSPRSGPAPLDVFFTSVTGQPVPSYRWSFGDGTPQSTLPNPSHRYAAPGSYTVTLEALMPSGWRTVTKQAYVVATDPPRWRQLQKLVASDASASDYFGYSLAISGNRLAIGARGKDGAASGEGAVYLFEASPGLGIWGEVAQVANPDPQSSDEFGSDVGLHGDTLLVGAMGDDDLGFRAGKAYVFDRDPTGAWNQVAELQASDPVAGAEFGESCDVEGDTAVVGASIQTAIGAVYVFERDLGGTDAWGQRARLSPPGGAAVDLFGTSVALDGDLLVVGSPGADDFGSLSGVAYVYSRDGAGTWTLSKRLRASDGVAGARYGTAVAVSGDIIVIGARGDTAGGNGAGAAYVLSRNEGGPDAWGELAKIQGLPISALGSSVAVHGDVALVGAEDDDRAGVNAGAVWVLERNENGVDEWGVAGVVTASDAAPSDFFGTDVCIQGGVGVGGAYFDDDAGSGSGSAYVIGYR